MAHNIKEVENLMNEIIVNIETQLPTWTDQQLINYLRVVQDSPDSNIKTYVIGLIRGVMLQRGISD